MKKSGINISILEFIKFSLPNVIASLSIPILGLADIAVIGKLNDAAMIAGVTVGTQIIDTLYWVFGNIKFVASGKSAQAAGTDDHQLRLCALLQPLLLISIISLILFLFQREIFNLFIYIINPETAVVMAAQKYYKILMFSLFFVLSDYIIRGW